MEDIKGRKDIALLIRTFYGEVQVEETLGPMFKAIIQDWEHHFEHLTDFWESNLFFGKEYQGNPIEKHIEVDRFHNESIEAVHFGIWLNLWFATIDDLFERTYAQLAKSRARNMGSFIHVKLFEARSK